MPISLWKPSTFQIVSSYSSQRSWQSATEIESCSPKLWSGGIRILFTAESNSDQGTRVIKFGFELITRDFPSIFCDEWTEQKYILCLEIAYNMSQKLIHYSETVEFLAKSEIIPNRNKNTNFQN